MPEPKTNLDQLMRDPKAAKLLKQKDLLKNLMQSPDTQRLMQLLNQSACFGRSCRARRGPSWCSASTRRCPRISGKGGASRPGDGESQSGPGRAVRQILRRPKGF